MHPRILTFRNPRKSLEELLSYSELAQPWRLYLTPGLLATQLVHITWIGLFTRIVRHLSVPTLGGLPPSTPASPDDDTYSGPSSGSLEVTNFGLAFFITWCVLSVVILSPIECAIVRLSVQRPERQQPLHLAYARVASNSTSTAPAPYNNQAQVQTALGQEGSREDYRDSAAPAQGVVRTETTPFAIEDEEDEEGEVGKRIEANDSTSHEAKVGGVSSNGNAATSVSSEIALEPGTKNSAPPSSSPRTLGGGPPTSIPMQSTYIDVQGQPSEPVIALRPCDEPQSAEEAARAEEEGFGAPTVERYTGMIDCLNKLVDEEGIEALYRGAWVTLLGIFAGNFA